MIVDDPMVVVQHAMVHSIDIFCTHRCHHIPMMCLNFSAHNLPEHYRLLARRVTAAGAAILLTPQRISSTGTPKCCPDHGRSCDHLLFKRPHFFHSHLTPHSTIDFRSFCLFLAYFYVSPLKECTIVLQIKFSIKSS